MRADLLQEFRHPAPLTSAAMGNAQVLPGDAMFVGWGTEPYLTEFGPGGEVRFDATFDGQGWNYRAFRNAWVGRPATKPRLAVTRHGKGITAYASWNGSTETAYWRISGGDAPGSLQALRTAASTGFETTLAVAARPRYVSVTALDASHRVLAASPVIPLK
jgi:hypothetical protein